MNIKRILIFCIALSILAYAQSAPTEDVEVRKPEDYTASTVSPFDIEDEADQSVQEVRKPEDYTASTESPFDFKEVKEEEIEVEEFMENTTERPLIHIEHKENEIQEETPEKPQTIEIVKENPENPQETKLINKTPEKSEIPKVTPPLKKPQTNKDSKKPKPEIIDEISIHYIDEYGNEVNYDKNLYYCENCNEDKKNKNEEIYTIAEEENYEMNGKEEVDTDVEFGPGIDFDNFDEEEYDEDEGLSDNNEEDDLNDDSEEEINDDLDENVEESLYDDDEDNDIIKIERREKESAFDDDEEGSGSIEEEMF